MARVLLLEDDLEQLEMRALILESKGHEVRRAVSIDEAMAHSADCDVAVIDLLPGVEKLVAQLPADAGVIVLSGRDAVNVSLSARTVEMLRKPCPSKLLVETIARVTWTSGSK
jgi:DNA-binding response OmpR family regulator